MADIIVKVPKDRNADYDYIAFSFNGKHSYEDFGITRVSDGSRYTINLTPALSDRTSDVPGMDGLYFFGTNYKQKDFAINFVFDGITHKQLSDMESWFDGKDLHPLWLAEEPYKVYMAKVTGTPQIKALPFDQEYIENGVKRIKRIFKGEGAVTFTAYNPVARTPDYVEVEEKFYYCSGTIRVSDIWVNPGDKLVVYSLDNDNCIPYDKPITTYIVDSSGDNTIQSNNGEYEIQDSGFLEGFGITESTYMCIYLKTATKTITLKPFASLPGQEIPEESGVISRDGQKLSSYDLFINRDQWAEASGLTDTATQTGGNVAGPAEASFYGWEVVEQGNLEDET